MAKPTNLGKLIEAAFLPGPNSLGSVGVSEDFDQTEIPIISEFSRLHLASDKFSYYAVLVKITFLSHAIFTCTMGHG